MEALMTSETTFRAAAVQDTPVWLDKERSVAKACALIAEAARGGANIVAFPESFIPGFPYWVFTKPLCDTGLWHTRFHDNAVILSGPEVQTLSDACAKAGIIAVVGVTERDADRIGTLYNTNLVFGSDGKLLGKHRKLMPTWGERAVWAGGDGSTLSVFPTSFGGLGTLCCGENINTLARFALLAQGERIHVANFPSASLAGGRHSGNELYLHVAPHAYEGKLYSIVSSDYGSPEVAAELGMAFEVPAGTFNCISGIIGPNGEWVTPPLVDKPGIAYADCPIAPVVYGKLFHDIIGHYNRFDVLRLEVDRDPVTPLRFTSRQVPPDKPESRR
jgi:nitrilase